MEFIGYGKQWIDENDIAAVVKTLQSDYLTQGPAIEEFERKLCALTGAKYCVAVANGTAALHLSVSALELEAGTEGITTPNTFVATSNSLLYNNLIAVFADIDERTYTIDPAEIEKHITSRTKVIIPVHFAGQPAEMMQIKSIAEKNNLYVIEDAAHAIGSRYENDSPVGNCQYSDMTVFSFHPVKTMTTGEGGAITTNNRELYNKLLSLRNHGNTKDPEHLENNPGPWYYEMHMLGFNYRLTDIQAALGISQLQKLEKFIERRREIVKRYDEAFQAIDWITTPFERKNVFSAFHLYVLQIDFNKIGTTRKDVMEELKEKNIGTQVHYIPVHTQPYYRTHFDYQRGDYPKAEKYYEKTLSIPLYPKMTDEEVEYVIENITRLS